MNSESSIVKTPRLWQAILPIVVLIALLVFNVVLYGDNATYGPNQIALLMAAAVAGVIGWSLRVKFTTMMRGIIDSMSAAIGAMLILLLIGSLAGTWMISGVIPALIYYGLDVLNPKIFLFASAVVCAIVSLATGSSWSTVATVGLALIGIGNALGVQPAMSAGAIISGAYFGDKMSPLSDTTNLASAMAGSELFEHIRHMMWTTVPSIVISLMIFLLIGFSSEPATSSIDTSEFKDAIAAKFNLTPWLFIVPLAVIVMVIRKFNALVALFGGVLLGGVFAIVLQPDVVREVSGSGSEQSYAEHAYKAFVNAMATKTELASDNEAAAELLVGKGMEGMLNTIWLIVTAMTFGGIMLSSGLLRRITDPLVKMAKSTGSLIATTAGSCIFVNFTASDQYLSIVVPGQMFRETYPERGLAEKNLSRTLEDSGTVTSVLIPWNTCGAAQAGVLSVATLAYAPFCFFCFISPLLTVLFGFAGIGIAKLAKNEN